MIAKFLDGYFNKWFNQKFFEYAPFKIGIAHIPPFRGWHGNEQIAEKFIPVLNKVGLDIMRTAQLHRYFAVITKSLLEMVRLYPIEQYDIKGEG